MRPTARDVTGPQVAHAAGDLARRPDDKGDDFK
jgi:hypothetical protein